MTIPDAPDANTWRFMKALIDLWDNHERRGYTQREIAMHAGYEGADEEPEYSEGHECPIWVTAAFIAYEAGLVDIELGDDPLKEGRSSLRLTPILA
jgi:hypothetical protein